MKKLPILILASLLMGTMAPLWGQVTISPLVSPRKQFLDASGRPLAGGHVCTYTVGSTTPQVTYTDYTGATPNGICDPLTDPPHSDGIVLDAGGRASIYIDCRQSPFKIVLYDANLNLEWSEDGVQYPGNCIAAKAAQSCPGGQAIIGFDIAGNAICTSFCVNCGGGGAVTCDAANDKTYYVDLFGSDAPGVQGGLLDPFATIQHGIDMVPSIVDGNYTIQLLTAGTYTGPVVVKDKLFFGGGYDYTKCTNPVRPCSNITISGDPLIGSTYIIQSQAADSASGNTIEVDASRLTLSGVTIIKGGYGIYATNNSFLTLDAIGLVNNYTALAILHDSKVLVLPDSYYDNDFANIFIDNSGLIGGVPFQGNFGILGVGNGAYITDLCEADKVSTGSGWFHIGDTNGGGWGTDAFLFQGGSAFIDNQVNIVGGDLFSEGATLLLRKISLDADNQVTTGISSAAGKITGGYYDGGPGIYSVSNAVNGVYAFTGGQVDPPTTVSGVTNVSRASHEVYGGLPHTIIGDFAHFPLQGAFVNVIVTGGGPWNGTFDLTTGNMFKVTLAENPTNFDIQNSSVGDTITTIFCQDGAGGNAITWSDTMIGDEAVGTTASKCNIQSFVRDDTAGSVKWYAMGPMIKNAD